MSASGGIPKARNFAPTSRQDTGRSATRQVSSEAIRIRTALFVWPRTEPDPSAARTVKRNAGAQCIRNLTVKLNGRAEAPDGRRGHTLSSSARGAKQTTHHGPLQRLLAVMLAEDRKRSLMRKRRAELHGASRNGVWE